MQTSALRFNDIHLLRMCDDTGIYQHTKFDVPDPREGYTTDDNARLMMMAAAAYEATGKREYLDLAYRGLSFLLNAQKDGWFRNLMSYERRFLDEEGSQDCVGRCIWSLGFVASRTVLPIGFRKVAEELLMGSLGRIEELNSLRANAYAVMGLCLWNKTDIKPQIGVLLKLLLDGYQWWSNDRWQWYEDKLTYCNAVIPHGLLVGASALGNAGYLNIALSSLDFLLDSTIRDNYFWPVGSNGWFCNDGENARYDQQPVEACATLLACLTAYKFTCNLYYLRAARLCLRWFTGNNSKNISMICPETGGCFDGITHEGPSQNLGAESLLSWYGSAIGFNLYLKQVRHYEQKEELFTLASIRR